MKFMQNKRCSVGKQSKFQDLHVYIQTKLGSLSQTGWKNRLSTATSSWYPLYFDGNNLQEPIKIQINIRKQESVVDTAIKHKKGIVLEQKRKPTNKRRRSLSTTTIKQKW